MNSSRSLVNGTAAVVLLVVLFPAFWMLELSFRTGGDIFDMRLVFTPTLENYRALWTGLFPGSLGNSVVVSLGATALSLLLGVPAAYVLSRWQFRRRRAVALWILATRMAPPIAYTIPFFLAYRFVGLLDTLTGVIMIYLTFNLAFVVWMMRNFFDGVPRALEEAGLDRRLRCVERFSAHRPAALGARARGDWRFVLYPVLERFLLRPDPDADQGDDGAGGDRQLHAV